MANNYTMVITQAVTIGNYKVPALAEAGAYYLQNVNLSLTYYIGNHIGDGVWGFGDVQDGVYELMSGTYPSGTKVQKYGRFPIKGEILPYVGLDGNEEVYGIKTFFDIPILPENNPSTDNHATRKGYTDGKYVNKSENEEIDGIKSFLKIPILPENNPSTDNQATRKGFNEARYLRKTVGLNEKILSNITFGDEENIVVPKINSEVAHFNNDYHIVNKKFVAYLIQQYLSGQITAYQQSANIVRILFSGVQENGRVYTTLSSGLTYAKTYAGPTQIFTIIIEGNGVGTGFPVNYNRLSPSDVGLYCNIQGQNQSVIMRVSDDSYYVGSLSGDRGKVIINNIRINTDAEEPMTSFNRFVFDSCYFDFNNAGSNITFDDCEFRGICIIKSHGLNMTNCKGAIYITNITPTETGTNPAYILTTNL